MYKLFFLFCFATSLNINESAVIPYNLKKIDIKLVLPAILHEISGITILDSTTVGCIQDENGILFLYDINRSRIRKQIPFGLNGDYEGICRVNNTLYILRSDGVIFEIENYTSEKLHVKEYKTGIPAINNEGLCYDLENNRLLIGSKGKINRDPLNKDKRLIYEFNLKTKLLNQMPVLNININDINLSAKLKGIAFLKKKNKNGDLIEVGFKLNTSEIAIHPITKQLYVLSSTDHCLFIFNLNGNLEVIEPLNPNLFNKAEGLSFFPNGDMLISNEGQAHQPTMLKFKYQQ
jgi:hypothetical protein